MADSQRGQVAPVRKLVSLVLGTFATFVILFGAGMTSWSIIMLGVALLVLAVSLVLISTVRGGARAWVAGVGHVHSVSEPPASSTFGRCELQIVIDAPGLPPRSVKIRDPRVPIAKWPDPGSTLPIMVAIDDQRHIRILWDEVPTHAETASAGALPPEFDAELGHHPDDDLLVGQDAPPWAHRTADDDPLLDPDDGYPTPRPEPSRYDEDPVVLRQTPGGTLVLEGTLVETAPAPPLPRRATSTSDQVPTGQRGGTVTATSAPPTTVPAAHPVIAEPVTTSAVAEPITADPAVAGTTGAEAGPADSTVNESTRASSAVADVISTDGSAGSAPRQRAGTAGGPVIDFGQPADEVDIDIDIDIDALVPDRSAGTDGDAPGADGADPIHGVGITLLVADLDRSVAFYRDIIGFAELDAGSGNAILASGATRLVLRSIPDVAPINRRVVHLNLEVADLDAAHRRLKARGVRFTYAPRVVNRGEKLELWAAAFRDPDGHGIALTQWRGRPADRGGGAGGPDPSPAGRRPPRMVRRMCRA